MGFILGIGVIVSAITGMCRDRGLRLFYGLGLPLGACCILAQLLL